MNGQLAFFDEKPRPAVHRNASAQELSAARRAADRLPSRRARIMEALDFSPMCDDSLCKVLGEHWRFWPSVKTARSGLKKDGLVVATGIECREHKQMIWRRADRGDHARTESIQAL